MNNPVRRSYACQEIGPRMTSTAFSFLVLLSITLLPPAH